MKKNIERRLHKVRMLCTDVDGVLTDSGMYYGENGVEMKKFSTRDGMGLSLLRIAGVIIVILTSEKTKIVQQRADKLKIKNLFQGVKDKAEMLDGLRKKYSLSWKQVAYIGDDINDLEVMGHVGFAATPSDGSQWNKRTAHYVTKRKGGEGCVREVCEMILAAKKLDRDIVSLYRNGK
ncbi:MAG: HAD hydrolase family protein [Bacteriovoracaceae bacterium]|nr:HAD hydrolase family protein [Bacteroidota bacterium]